MNKILSALGLSLVLSMAPASSAVAWEEECCGWPIDWCEPHPIFPDLCPPYPEPETTTTTTTAEVTTTTTEAPVTTEPTTTSEPESETTVTTAEEATVLPPLVIERPAQPQPVQPSFTG